MDASNDRPSLHLNNGSPTREATQRAPFGFIEVTTGNGEVWFIATDRISAVLPYKVNGVPALNSCALVVEGIPHPPPVEHNVREIGRRIDYAKAAMPGAYSEGARGLFFEKALPMLEKVLDLLSQPGGRLGPPMPYTPTPGVIEPLDPDTPPRAAMTAAIATPPPPCRHCTQPMAPAHGGGFECIPCGLTAPDPHTAPAPT